MTSRFWSFRSSLLSLLVLACLTGTRADVRLPAMFSDHMVLQQMIAIPVWGWADDGERVVVEFRKSKVSTTARNGRWMVRLPRQAAGGPDTLVISGHNTITIQDVMVGEVWICSGQSNMEWPMRLTENASAAIAAAQNPQLRLFTVPKLKSQVPVQDVKASWQLSSQTTVENFSAVAYYFGRELQRARGVAVGLIHTSWGGSPAEVWMSEAMLASNPEYQRDILDAYPPAWRRYQADLAAYEREVQEAKQAGRQPKRGRPWPTWRPTELYNGMIAPLIPYAIRGAIWYQGESNAGRAYQYRTLFADLIRNWRRDWRQGPFTFLAVQLAPWDMNRQRSLETIAAKPGDSSWAELREAQMLATQVLPKVGVAVITDVGDKDDIHPQNKRPVGERLARLARSIAHHENLVATGPVYRSHTIREGKIRISFSHTGAGLGVRGDRLEGFSILDEKGQPRWAEARIVSRNQVEVSHPDVPHPVGARYGWADYPVVNLFNLNGLPASPFRTDRLPLTTQPKAPAQPPKQ